MEIKHLSFTLLILLAFIIYTNGNAPECIYNLYIETGSFPEAGTHANISIFLSDYTSVEMPINNVRDWGLMGSDYNYFSPGGVDLFAGKGPCLHGSVCRIIMVLTGFDAWYCESIEVTMVGLDRSCYKKYFSVQKWLDVNKGSAVILQDECSSSDWDITVAASSD